VLSPHFPLLYYDLITALKMETIDLTLSDSEGEYTSSHGGSSPTYEIYTETHKDAATQTEQGTASLKNDGYASSSNKITQLDVVAAAAALVSGSGEFESESQLDAHSGVVDESAASVPEVSAPEVSAPVVSAAEVSNPAPEVSVPEVSVPEVSQPEVSVPEVSVPEVSQPEVSAPEVSQPEALQPEAFEPQTELAEPQFKVPAPPQKLIGAKAQHTEAQPNETGTCNNKRKRDESSPSTQNNVPAKKMR
jgi:hypothetical protein